MSAAHLLVVGVFFCSWLLVCETATIKSTGLGGAFASAKPLRVKSG